MEMLEIRPLLLQALVFKVVIFVLDDLYLSWRQRAAIARVTTVPTELADVMSQVRVPGQVGPAEATVHT